MCRYLVYDLRDDDGQPVCDHLWITPVRDFDGLKLWRGDYIRFRATVRRYERKDGSKDFTLDIHSIEKLPTPALVVA